MDELVRLRVPMSRSARFNPARHIGQDERRHRLGFRRGRGIPARNSFHLRRDRSQL
jgi:hypothetical protein